MSENNYHVPLIRYFKILKDSPLASRLSYHDGFVYFDDKTIRDDDMAIFRNYLRDNGIEPKIWTTMHAIEMLAYINSMVTKNE